MKNNARVSGENCRKCSTHKYFLTSTLIFSSLICIFVIAGSGLLNAGDLSHKTKQLWQKMKSEKYQEKWSLFPGTEKLYKGTEPHGMLLTTYINKKAKEALDSGVDVMPEDSILIKENYKPDKTMAAITVMEKTGPEKDDWFWVKYLPDGSVDTMETVKNGKKMKMPVAGGVETMCAKCHAASVAGIHNIMTPIK